MSKSRSKDSGSSSKSERSPVALPENLLSIAFRSLSYRKVGSELEVAYQLLLPPVGEWRTALAISAGESMRPLFDQVLTGDVPLDVQERYYLQNLVLEEQRNGQTIRLYQPEAYEDAIAKGYLQWTRNQVEPVARRVLEFLAGNVDTRKACNLMYVGCDRSSSLVDLGEIPLESCGSLSVHGPDGDFGRNPTLLPLIEFLADAFSGGKQALAVILTDGTFSDLPAVKSYSEVLLQLMRAGRREFLRFQLLGIGDKVNASAMAELTGVNTSDNPGLWSYRHADDAGDLRVMLEGIIAENQMLPPGAAILDEKGKTIRTFDKGLPAKGSFKLPLDATSFALKMSASKDPISQSLLLPFHKTLTF